MKILAIESSCDETAVSIVEDGIKEISSSLATSREVHELTGGVVPEIAARKQLDFMVPVLELAMRQKNLTPKDIDAIAVTVGPGLIGSLIVGVEASKALAVAWNKPLIPVNHLIGHIYANFVDSSFVVEFPALVLVVSGGHTDLVLMKGHGELEFLGGTLDDAAGEAFDKTARLLGIADYLGGAKLSKLASTCEEIIEPFLPRPLIDKNNYDFSFSGLKTAVKRVIEDGKYPVDVVAKEFENAVVDVLVHKTIKAALESYAKCILVGGGVSANTKLRTVLTQKAQENGIPINFPPFSLCTDNGVGIASAAYFNQKHVNIEDIQPNPSLGITDLV